MIDHVTFGVTDMAKSRHFYDAAFAPLGLRLLVSFRDRVDVAAYGDERPWFWIAAEDATRGMLHLALTAPDRAAVRSFHTAAVAAGGTDNGAPGVRLHYNPDYHGAFVLDPDRNNIEAVCRRPA